MRSGTSDYQNRLPAGAKVVKIDDYAIDFITNYPNPIHPSEIEAIRLIKIMELHDARSQICICSAPTLDVRA